MLRDVRDALRGFGRTPGFTAAATLALGVAIGSAAAIFSLVDGLWLRPPGAARPQELVRVFQTSPASSEGNWSWPEYEALRDRTTSLAGLAAMGRRGAVMPGPDGSPELLLANVVSLDFFTVMDVVPAAGRLFSPLDERALAAEPAVVLGHAFWLRRFGGDVSIVGRPITLGVDPGTPVTVVGVLPKTFREIDPAADRDLWMPVTTWAALNGREEFDQRTDRWFHLIGRLESTGTNASATDEVRAVAAALAAEWPATNTDRSARLQPDVAYRLETGGSNIAALMGLVLAVVLITCVNIAHLLFARAAARRREMALRTAIGASRGRLIRLLLVEAGTLGALGAGAGLLTGAWLVRALPWFLATPPGFRSSEVFLIDGRVLIFSLGVAVVTTMLFGLAPAIQAARANVSGLLKGGAGRTGAPRLDRRIGHGLMVGQIGVSLALVYGAAVLAQSARAIERTDLGFSRDPIVTAWIPYGDAPMSIVQEAVDRVAALRGVGDVAIAIRAPLSLSGSGLAQPVGVPGSLVSHATAPPDVRYGAVSANYFDVMGTPIVRGRAFTEAESRGGEPVAVVTQAFVERFFPDVDPIGRLVQLRGVDHRVVGVAADASLNRIGQAAEPYFYLPYWRQRHGEGTLLIRPDGPTAPAAADLRAALGGFDRRLDARLVVSMPQYIAFASSDYRTTAALAATLSAIGLFLMTVGIYGVLTYQTSRRAREIGIRVAVGAARVEVMRLVLADGLRLTAAGLLLGIPLALLTGRGLSSLLYGVGPWSWPTLLAASVVLVAAVLGATWVPAWRATRVSPMTALRDS
ncbi:MAG TPA: ADOP family duplicated permease [Vicinamibacterales bacterium]|nr:ADOP family duplicated permease [Vicinamibacterales bacterium]